MAEQTVASVAFTGASGVLTVTDGTHVAKINLTGDYTAATFTAASDGHGGVAIVAAPTPPLASHVFVAAIAGLAARGEGLVAIGASYARPQTALAAPHG